MPPLPLPLSPAVADDYDALVQQIVRLVDTYTPDTQLSILCAIQDELRGWSRLKQAAKLKQWLDRMEERR